MTTLLQVRGLRTSSSPTHRLELAVRQLHGNKKNHGNKKALWGLERPRSSTQRRPQRCDSNTSTDDTRQRVKYRPPVPSARHLYVFRTFRSEEFSYNLSDGCGALQTRRRFVFSPLSPSPEGRRTLAPASPGTVRGGSGPAARGAPAVTPATPRPALAGRSGGA